MMSEAQRLHNDETLYKISSVSRESQENACA